MRKLRALSLRFRGLFKRIHDLDAELESNLQLHTDDNIRTGMSPEEAARQARMKLGGIEQTRQAMREQSTLPNLVNLSRDVSFAMRTLAKHRVFTCIAVLTLALGIGANTALFSVVNGVLLNPLPYPHAEELVTVHASKQNFAEGSISYLNFRDWQRDNKTLAALAVSRGTGYSLTGMGDTEEVRAELVSSSFFQILGVKPFLGRFFLPGEDELNRAPIALISQGFRARKFGSNGAVIGKSITLDGDDYTIVGVVPVSFNLAIGNFRAADIYVPIGQFRNPALNDRAAGLGIHGIARLKPGVTLAQAQDDMDRLSQQLEKQFPQEDKGIRARLVPFQEAMVREVRPLLFVLLGAVGFVLLIACCNVANLFLARSSERVREFAVRSALGAGRARLIRQLLTESTLIALAGGVLGLVLAAMGTHSIVKLLPQDLPRAAEIHLSLPVLIFTMVVSLASGIFFGLAPASMLLRRSLYPTLRESGRGAGNTRHRGQDALVIFQMAIALVLLSGAGLLIHSLQQLTRVDPGFRPAGVMTFGLQAPPSLSNATQTAQLAYLREAEHRIATTPGVDGAALSWAALPMGGDDEQLFWLPGEAKPMNAADMHMSILYIVSSGYLKTMGVPLLRGRFLLPSDDERAQRVVVIDDVFAKKFFPHVDPIGQVVHLDNYEDGPATIVGIVGHVNQWGLDLDSTQSLRAEMYQSIFQLRPVQLGLVTLGMDVVIQTSLGQQAAFQSLQNQLAQMNRQQVAYNPQSMEGILADTMAGRRFAMRLLSLFAAIALLLASLGMYGVLSNLVGQRTQEIGIRMALGASRSAVLAWVMNLGGRLAVIGATTGLAAAMLLTQIISHLPSTSSLVFGKQSAHPWSVAPWAFVAVTVVMLFVSLLACCIPARRAMRIDPMRTLRTE